MIVYYMPTSNLGKISVNVEGVVVSTEPVESCLDGQGLVLERGIWGPRWRSHCGLEEEVGTRVTTLLMEFTFQGCSRTCVPLYYIAISL